MRTLARLNENWRSLITLLLLVTQGVVAVTPLIEGRGGIGEGAHVEAPKDAHHYAHAEADCAYCSVRTVSARAAELPPAPLFAVHVPQARVSLTLAPAAAETPPGNATRAPPR